MTQVDLKIQTRIDGIPCTLLPFYDYCFVLISNCCLEYRASIINELMEYYSVNFKTNSNSNFHNSISGLFQNNNSVNTSSNINMSDSNLLNNNNVPYENNFENAFFSFIEHKENL